MINSMPLQVQQPSSVGKGRHWGKAAFSNLKGWHRYRCRRVAPLDVEGSAPKTPSSVVRTADSVQWNQTHCQLDYTRKCPPDVAVRLIQVRFGRSYNMKSILQLHLIAPRF